MEQMNACESVGIDDDDRENQEAMADPGILLPKTLETYTVYIKKFAAFLGLGDIASIPKVNLTDENFAGFILDLGLKNDYKPHFKKTALACLSYLVRVNCMLSIFDFKHLYPHLHNALSVSAIYRYSQYYYINICNITEMED